MILHCHGYSCFSVCYDIVLHGYSWGNICYDIELRVIDEVVRGKMEDVTGEGEVGEK